MKDVTAMEKEKLSVPNSNTGTNSNFPTDFLGDFQLGRHHKETTLFHWEFYKKALERFHLPITYMELDGNEDGIHYGKKQTVHDYIYETYYLNDGCKFYVTTELKQILNPFQALLVENGEEKVYYKLDICAIRLKDHQVFDIEIDGPEHGTDRAMLKDRMRDRLLNWRYGIFTLRFDKFDEINFKKIDDFLNQPAMTYTRKRKIKGQKIPRPAGYDY